MREMKRLMAMMLALAAAMLATGILGVLIERIAFRTAGDTVLKQVIHTAPSGFEDFFTRIAEEFAGQPFERPPQGESERRKKIE